MAPRHSCSSSSSFGEALRLEAFGLRGFHVAVQQLPAVLGRCRELQSWAHFSDGLVLAEQLFGGDQLADDLYSLGEAFGYGGVAFTFHRASPGQVWSVGKLS